VLFAVVSRALVLFDEVLLAGMARAPVLFAVVSRTLVLFAAMPLVLLAVLRPGVNEPPCPRTFLVSLCGIARLSRKS
jgi:hypothetical protein